MQFWPCIAVPPPARTLGVEPACLGSKESSLVMNCRQVFPLHKTCINCCNILLPKVLELATENQIYNHMERQEENRLVGKFLLRFFKHAQKGQKPGPSCSCSNWSKAKSIMLMLESVKSQECHAHAQISQKSEPSCSCLNRSKSGNVMLMFKLVKSWGHHAHDCVGQKQGLSCLCWNQSKTGAIMLMFELVISWERHALTKTCQKLGFSCSCLKQSKTGMEYLRPIHPTIWI